MDSRHPEGYDSKIFVIKPHKIFTCSICSKILKNSKICPKGQHVFCGDCIDYHLRTLKSCPKCTIRLNLNVKQFTKYNLFDSILNDSVTFCVAKDAFDATDRKVGDCCDWQGPLKMREQHWEQDCNYRPVKCDNVACPENIEKRFLTVHKSACKFAIVQCEKCTDTCFVNDLNAHMLVCEHRDIHCVCGQCLPKSAMTGHIAKDCSLMHMECPLLTRNLACSTCTPGTLYHRDNMMEHLILSKRCQLTIENNNIGTTLATIPNEWTTVSTSTASNLELIVKCQNNIGAAHGAAVDTPGDAVLLGLRNDSKVPTVSPTNDSSFRATEAQQHHAERQQQGVKRKFNDTKVL